MTRHVIGVFKNANQVHEAVTALLGEGIAEDRVSVLRWEDPDHGEELLEYDQEERAQAINTGLWSGGALGAVAGLLAGAISLVAAPVGAVAVLGSLAMALEGATIGATVGGFVGTLTKLGFPRPDAERLMERMEAGDVLLAVTTPTAEAQTIAERLAELGASEVKIG
jgi:hypothetical protein